MSISGRDTGHQYCQHPESGRLEGVKTTLKGSPPACLFPAASSFCPGPGSFSTRTFFRPTQGNQSLCQLPVSLLSPPPATALYLPAANSRCVSAFL